MYNRKKRILCAGRPASMSQKRVREEESEVAAGTQKRVRFWCRVIRKAGSQNWVRRRNGYASGQRAPKSLFSNAAAQNWVRKWNGEGLRDAELGTQGSRRGFGKPGGVPISAGITTPERRFTRYTWLKTLGVRRNGYAFGVPSCGKACGNRELSTQKPVRALR